SRVMEGSEDIQRLIETGKTRWNEALDHAIIKDGYIKSLSSNLNATWSAFETLASDLWATAINKNPNTFAIQVAYSSQNEQSTGSRSVDITELAQYKFDVKAMMGTILKKKFKFTDPLKIQSAYATMLPKKTDTSFLENSDLVLLAGVRHILLHKAGIIDEQFVAFTKSTLPIGTAFPVDEAIMYQSINAVIETSRVLLRTILDHFEQETK
ncbi:MAG TPA: hypothetical protein VFO76_05215, partial [Candidatus Kapabacteria bacterium]|nr:hypothetical protein [Candidatus Kapabacteria bacterium]